MFVSAIIHLFCLRLGTNTKIISDYFLLLSFSLKIKWTYAVIYKYTYWYKYEFLRCYSLWGKKSYFKDVQSDSIENYAQLITGKHIKTYVLAKVCKETYEFLHSTQWMAQSSLWRIGIAHTSSSAARSLQAKNCKAGFRYCAHW